MSDRNEETLPRPEKLILARKDPAEKWHLIMNVDMEPTNWIGPSERNREILNISFMNDIYILYGDRDMIGTKPPDDEL
jgi:hypothetical protein